LPPQPAAAASHARCTPASQATDARVQSAEYEQLRGRCRRQSDALCISVPVDQAVGLLLLCLSMPTLCWGSSTATKAPSPPSVRKYSRDSLSHRLPWIQILQKARRAASLAATSAASTRHQTAPALAHGTTWHDRTWYTPEADIHLKGSALIRRKCIYSRQAKRTLPRSLFRGVCRRCAIRLQQTRTHLLS
jgi:hypothetical protein